MTAAWPLWAAAWLVVGGLFAGNMIRQPVVQDRLDELAPAWEAAGCTRRGIEAGLKALAVVGWPLALALWLYLVVQHARRNLR